MVKAAIASICRIYLDDDFVLKDDHTTIMAHQYRWRHRNKQKTSLEIWTAVDDLKGSDESSVWLNRIRDLQIQVHVRVYNTESA